MEQTILTDEQKVQELEKLMSFPRHFEQLYNYDERIDYAQEVQRFNQSDATGKDAILRKHGGRIPLTMKCQYQRIMQRLGID